MPTTSKQKKARKSREAEMLSDIEIPDITVKGNHSEREESENSNSIRRPDSPSYNTRKQRRELLLFL